MSKLNFRARNIDVSKPLQVYRASEVPDIEDASTTRPALAPMATGMEKEEEEEHHIQVLISSSTVNYSDSQIVIPTPETEEVVENFDLKYKSGFKQPKHNIRYHAGYYDDAIDYDMDTDDEGWLQTFNASVDPKVQIRKEQFEQMIDRLEKASPTADYLASPEEARRLLEGVDDDVFKAVLERWRARRQRRNNLPIEPFVRTLKKPGDTSYASDPYVAFRRRNERMQTRKNRKNDETSYERMLKLRRDFERARSLLEMLKRREKLKRENVNLSLEVFTRYHLLGEVPKPPEPPPRPVILQLTGEGLKKKKRRLDSDEASSIGANGVVPKIKLRLSTAGLDSFERKKRMAERAMAADVDMDAAAEEEEPVEDGPFAFRRRKEFAYHLPLADCRVPVIQSSSSCFSRRLRVPRNGVFVSCARRRMGRGGRMFVDRADSEDVLGACIVNDDDVDTDAEDGQREENPLTMFANIGSMRITFGAFLGHESSGELFPAKASSRHAPVATVEDALMDDASSP